MSVIEVLILCTANINRSPMAEGILRRRLTERGIDVTLGSAGFLTEGEPASDNAAIVLDRRGVDLYEHRTRRLTPELVDNADLVITMAREHLRSASVMTRDAFDKTFTLKELLRRAVDVGPRVDDEPISAWLARAGAGRNPQDLLGNSRADDVADPQGRGVAAFERCADELESLIGGLVPFIWP